MVFCVLFLLATPSVWFDTYRAKATQKKGVGQLSSSSQVHCISVSRRRLQQIDQIERLPEKGREPHPSDDNTRVYSKKTDLGNGYRVHECGQQTILERLFADFEPVRIPGLYCGGKEANVLI